MDAMADPYANQPVTSMMNVSDVQLGESIRERLKVQRDTGRFCDVVFHVHSIEFLAHRCVLAACSPYFDSVLDLNRCGKEHLTISADWKIFSELIDFIYTGKIYIHEGNVAELLRLSGYFLMSGLKDYCGEFLERSMCIKDCLGIKALSEKCGLLNLAINSTAFIQDRINEITGELELLELSKTKFEAFLNNKAFNISNELKLVMISRWVTHMLSGREEDFKTLLTLIPIQQVDHLRVIEIIQIENLYHVSQHCLYHILHELYSFGVHLGSLEVTYSDLCHKVADQPALEGNVLDLAVNSALGDITPSLQETAMPDPNVRKETTGTEGACQGLESSVVMQDNPSMKEIQVANQDNFFNVVLPTDVSPDGEKIGSEPKIVDHLSYTKAEDMDIVKEHLFEETDSGGLVHFKPRFQGSRNEKSGNAAAGKSTGIMQTSTGSAEVAGKDYFPVIAKKEAVEDAQIKEVTAETAAEAVATISDFYEAETDDNADAEYVVEDEDEEDEDEVVPKIKVKAEPKEVVPERNRRKRKGRPRKTENVNEETDGGDSGSEEEEEEEWKVESLKTRQFTKARKKLARAKQSTTSSHSEKKKLIMKISVKRKKGAKKQVPPKRNRVKVKAETFKCEECNFTARSMSRIEIHSRSAHKQSVVQACNQCDFKTSWNKEYFQHMRGHFTGPPFSCDDEDCKYVTDKFQLLLHHRRRHSDERPFECETCQMKFRTKNNLTSHVRCHSGKLCSWSSPLY
jgi:hypothetical protein